MSLKSLFAGAVPVVCTGIFIPQMAVAAVVVEVNDGSGETLCSGDLVNMSTTTGKVTVGMKGNCGAGVGNLGSTRINMGSVDEGSYTPLIKNILNGVTFTPPVTATAGQSNLGVTPSIIVKTDLTYDVSYSAANVVVDANTSDAFTVTVTDSADPAQTATLNFDVAVNDVAAPPPPPPGSDCVDTSTLFCKGDLDLSLNGEQWAVPIDYNTTQVWTIKPEKRSGFENLIFDYLSNQMTVSISSDYTVDSADPDCTITLVTGNLYMNESDVAYQCHVQPDVTYYLRVTSSQSGRYSVFY